MSTVLKRMSLVGVAALLTVSVVGCGTGPAKAGSAAIVGDESISLEAVQDRTVTVLKKERQAQELRDQGKLDVVSRLVLADEIVHRLADNAAKRENITIDETKVFDAVEENGGPEEFSKGSEHDATTIYRRQRDALVMGELTRRNLTTLEVVADYFHVQDPKEAREKAAELVADPSKVTEFVQAAPRTTSGGQASGTNQRFRVTENPQLATSTLWSARPGTVVAFPADQQGSSWMVALVKERNKVRAVPGEEDLADNIREELRYWFGVRIAQFLAQDLTIEVNPRYGVWDPTSAQVVAVAGERAGFVGESATKNKS